MVDCFLGLRIEYRKIVSKKCTIASIVGVSKPLDKNETTYSLRWKTKILDSDLECILYSIDELFRKAHQPYRWDSRNEEQSWNLGEDEGFLWAMAITIGHI